ncbi:MAG: hypothetical protein HJHJAOHD_02531 [Flavobacteriales bacterium]|nr:hypothetical protein [Flavobacteriales bacterium]
MRISVNTSNKFSTFGSTQPNPNNLNANQYRYGFGGMEQDKQSSSYTTYFRQYDPRIARWKSTDPVTQPWQSPYTAFDNNPILYVDPMGDVSWCGIGTVFSGLASFAGNMALRALPTLGLNIALNNFLPNATHTGNNSGRFFGVDGGTTNNNIIPEEVRNKGGYWLDEFEVVDNAPKNFWDGMVDGGNDLRSSIDYYLKALADGKWDIVWNFIYSTSFGSMGNQQIYPGSESEFTAPANSYEWGQAVFNMLPYIATRRSTNAFKHSYKYASRIRARALQDPVAHNFPYSFDDVILKAKPIAQADGSLLFRKAGTLNGKSGFFEIGLNPNTKTIFHRTFVGAK